MIQDMDTLNQLLLGEEVECKVNNHKDTKERKDAPSESVPVTSTGGDKGKGKTRVTPEDSTGSSLGHEVKTVLIHCLADLISDDGGDDSLASKVNKIQQLLEAEFKLNATMRNSRNRSKIGPPI